MKHPRPRWLVTVWQSSWLVPGYAVQVASHSFRWRWLASVYAIWAAPRVFGFWAEIEREAPKLKVIQGGGAYEPRGVA